MCHAVIVPRARLKAGALAHKLAYVTFSDEDGQKVALHLTNQLFLDQYLVIEAAESVPEDLEPAQGHPGTDTLEADLKSTGCRRRRRRRPYLLQRPHTPFSLPSVLPAGPA